MASAHNTSLPAYNIPELSGSSFDQLGQFETIINQVTEKGVINDVPTSNTETYDFEKQRLRLQTIASRLYLLGYINKKIPIKNIECSLEKIKSAVHTFQVEADLKNDGWVEIKHGTL